MSDGILGLDYAKGRKKSKSLIYRLWRRTYEVIRAISTYLPPNQPINVLDLGCAEGSMLNTISSLFEGQFTGIELSSELYSLAQSQFPNLILFNQDINNLDFLHCSHYDVIICTAVIEHLEDPAKLLSSIKRLLKPGGITIWTVPDPFLEDIATRVGHLEDEQHHHVPNLVELTNMSISSGLNVLEARKFMLSPVGLPFEFTIESIIRRLRLSVLLANQLVVSRKP